MIKKNVTIIHNRPIGRHHRPSDSENPNRIAYLENDDVLRPKKKKKLIDVKKNCTRYIYNTITIININIMYYNTCQKHI